MTKTEKIETDEYAVKLKTEISQLATTLDARGKRRLKRALMQSDDCSETTARHLVNGDYQPKPRQALIEHMEGVLANFGKAKAS